jgi:hypothetical protein
MTGLVVGGAVALTLVLATVAPHIPPPGVDALGLRVQATTTQSWRGDVVVAAAQHPGDGGFTTVAMISSDSPGVVFSNPLSLEAGRTATGLGSVLTLPIDRILTAVADTSETQPAQEWGRLLDADPALALRIVVRGEKERALLEPLLADYGPSRVEIIVATA